MKKIFSTLMCCLVLACNIASSQESASWTDTDRKYLIENLIRTRDEIIKETSNLSKEPWSFKESPDRWSINQVVEHIAIWELILDNEISKALSAGLQPEFSKSVKPDSMYLGFILEEKPHISIEYTKPFTYTLPMGLNDGKNNVAWFVKMRDESIEYLKTAKEDLRGYYQVARPKNIHQVYITIFGHSQRHLRQIMKIKAHANYPKR